MVYHYISKWRKDSFEAYVIKQIGGSKGLPKGAVRCSCEIGAIVQQVDASIHTSDFCLKCSIFEYMFITNIEDTICDIKR